MAKLPLYEQQTTMGQVRASGQEFGSGVARAAGELGGVVQDIGVSIANRNAAIDAARNLQTLDEELMQGVQAAQDTDDIRDPQAVERFRQSAIKRGQEIIAQHRGTSESRARLQMQVENQVAQYTKSLISAQVKAQQSMIGGLVDQKANELAISAASAPQMIGELFTELDSKVDEFKDGISSELSRQYKEAGRSRIVSSAIQRLLVDRNTQAAKSMLQNPEVGKYLDPDSARRFSIDIAVDEGKQAAEIARQDRNVSKYTMLAGRNLSPEEVIKVRSLPEKKDMTVADQIVEYELVTGKPATQLVIDQFYKVDGPAGGGGSMFGNSLQGRALSYVTENAVAYANGMLTADQARVYEASLAEAYKPVMRPDPVTGIIEEVRPTIPNFVTQASEQGARIYGGTTLTNPRAQGGAPMPGQTVMLTLPDGRQVGPGKVGPDGTWSITDTAGPAPAPGGSPAAGGQPSQDVASMPLVDLAPYLTGVSSGIGRAVSDMPLGIGDTFGNPIYAQAAQRAKNMIEAVTNASKPETKIAEQYRQELRDLVDLGTKSFGSELAYHARAVEIDRELRRKLSEVEKKIDGATPTTLEERKAAIEIRNDILAVLPEIGVPQKVAKTRKEVEALPSGTRFRFGDDPTPRTRK